jgi:hypothetical protein
MSSGQGTMNQSFRIALTHRVGALAAGATLAYTSNPTVALALVASLGSSVTLENVWHDDADVTRADVVRSERMSPLNREVQARQVHHELHGFACDNPLHVRAMERLMQMEHSEPVRARDNDRI